MRILLQYILPLAFPAALYLVWWLYHKKSRAPEHHIDLSKGPWIWLLLAGILLTGVGLIFFNQLGSEDVGGVYQPPQYIDGKVVPGKVIHDQ